MNEHTLKGKVALITGAGSGLGAATARAFADARSSVACVDIDVNAAERVCDKITRQDITALALKCDVSDANAVTATVQAICERFGRLDVW